MKSAGRRREVLVDACVMIDYVYANRAIFALWEQHYGRVRVVREVAREVKAFQNEEEIEKLGVEIVDLPVEDLALAAQLGGRLSFQDHLCVLASAKYRCVCVTNDKLLRAGCAKRDVPTMWGLELLIDLHKIGCINTQTAEETARKIHSNNPKHITERIVNEFLLKIQPDYRGQ